VARAGGEVEPLTEGSTRPFTSTVTHAGIVKVKRYAFSMPRANCAARIEEILARG
jgi:hypothetical protein